MKKISLKFLTPFYKGPCMFKKSLLTICLLFNFENSPMFQKTMIRLISEPQSLLFKAAGYLAGSGYSVSIDKEKHTLLASKNKTISYDQHITTWVSVSACSKDFNTIHPEIRPDFEVTRRNVYMQKAKPSAKQTHDLIYFTKHHENSMTKSGKKDQLYDILKQVDKFEF